MDKIPTSTASPTTLIQDVSGVLPPCLRTPSLEPGLQPRYLGNLLDTITSLRMALASVSASAWSVSSELVASMDDLRAATASIAASASSEVVAAQASAADAISSAEASTASPLPTAQPSGAQDTKPEDMGKQISVPIAIAAIIGTAVGTCLLSLLGYYFVTRRRKAKHREHEEEKEVNAALDRAIVSYIAKEPPSPHGSAAPPDGPQQSQPQPAMTTAVDAKMDSAEGGGLAVVNSPQPLHEEPPTTPAVDQRQSLRRSETSVTGTSMMTGASTTDTSRPLRRTASSHFLDSAERVYASILASPLERLKNRASPRQEEPVPTARDDVGWPLPARDSWL